MKGLKKSISALIAITMALCSNVICSAEKNTDFNEKQSAASTISVPDIESDNSANETLTSEHVSEADRFESDIVLKYQPKTRGTFASSDYIYNTDTLTSTDAVDFYTFKVSGTRSVIFRLVTSNSDYVAIICPYNPTTGDITLSGPYVAAGEIKAIGDFNSDNRNDYCVVVLNQGTTYGTSYTFALNAKNSGGATAFLNANGDLSNAAFNYSGGPRINGESIRNKVNAYIQANIDGTETGITRVYERKYEVYHTGGVYNLCTVGMSTAQRYLDLKGMSYGTYSATKYEIPHAIFIPVNGGTYLCHRNTNVDGVSQSKGEPEGYIVYDIVNDEIVDWASEQNYFYTIYYNEKYTINSLIIL